MVDTTQEAREYSYRHLTFMNKRDFDNRLTVVPGVQSGPTVGDIFKFMINLPVIYARSEGAWAKRCEHLLLHLVPSSNGCI
jgi:hypothetical protein